jgi:hypothetical protein
MEHVRRTETFEGGDKQQALDLAFMWVSNCGTPVFVEKVDAVRRDGKWVATLTYREPQRRPDSDVR